MTHIPSTKELQSLHSYLEEDGFSEHDFTIINLTEAANKIGAPRHLVDKIADTSLPEITQRTALGQLANEWPEHLEASNNKSSTFDKLLSAWRSHQDLRKEQPTPAALHASRRRLDHARSAMARHSHTSGCGLSPC